MPRAINTMAAVTTANRQYTLSWASALSLAALVTVPLITSSLLRNRKSQEQMPLNSIPSLPLFLAAKKHAEKNPDKVAVIDSAKGREFTFGQLLADAGTLKKVILEELGLTDTGDLAERRIAFLAPNGYDYVVTQWAVWAAGGVCVPLCTIRFNCWI